MTEKKIVVPGDLLTEQRKKLGTNVYMHNDKVYSSVVGILSESNDYVSVIALNGPYSAHIGDGIVAIVKDEMVNGYLLDYNSSSDVFIQKSKISKVLKIGTVIFARIGDINDNDSLELDNINVLPNGRIFSTSPVKVPRLIGKNDSMLNLFKEHGNANVVVGKNGWIWYMSEKYNLLERAFNLVVKNSQKSNLTNSIKEFLEKNKSDKI